MPAYLGKEKREGRKLLHICRLLRLCGHCIHSISLAADRLRWMQINWVVDSGKDFSQGKPCGLKDGRSTKSTGHFSKPTYTNRCIHIWKQITCLLKFVSYHTPCTTQSTWIALNCLAVSTLFSLRQTSFSFRLWKVWDDVWISIASNQRWMTFKI